MPISEIPTLMGNEQKRRGQLPNYPANPDESTNSFDRGAESGAQGPQVAGLDNVNAPCSTTLHPAVARINEVWPDLPPHIQDTIKTLIEFTAPQPSLEGERP
jgi:hypothetical protein